MGSFVGHVLPGIAFLALGLWHLFNHIKLHTLQPNSYMSSPWFPTSKIRYLELYFIMVASSLSISAELFIGPVKHHPFDVDGTIPSKHLRNLEHASISLSFFVYAASAILIDRIGPNNRGQWALTQVVGAISLGQEFLLFHLHSTDHHGLEGQYHLLLQLVVVVCFSTTLMGIGLPRSFLMSFVRSASIFFQGVWFIVMGYALWTPELIPKGCKLHNDDGHIIVICASEEALHRGKSLVNILFSWFLVGITIFAVCFYLGLVEMYGKSVHYSSLTKELEELQEESDDVESQKKNEIGDLKSSIQMGKGFEPFDMER